MFNFWKVLTVGLAFSNVATALSEGLQTRPRERANVTTSASIKPSFDAPSTTTSTTTNRPILSKRYSQSAASVCQSPAFELTLTNWQESGASDFLSRWAINFVGDREYSGRGILGSLAYSYLGRNDFRCAVGSSHSCMVTCNEVVSLIEDPHDARAVFFIMTAARHYLEVVEVADKSLLAAQVNVGQWADTMSAKFFWTQETSHDRVFRMTAGLIQSFVSFVVFTFVPMVPFHLLEKAINIKLADEANGANFDQAAAELLQKKQALESAASTVKTAAKWTQIGYGAIAGGVPILGIPATDLFSWEGYEKAQILNIAELGLLISQLITETRQKNLRAVEDAFSGRLLDTKGSTMLGQILEGGAYLAVNSKMMHQWSSHQAEKRLTDALKYRILSEALKSQGVFIQCTTDMNAFSCENDTRGPQNLKACIDNRVCYMNKWSGRGYWWRHHVEEPFGADQMGDWPMLVTPEDIIVSSYRTYKKERSPQRSISQDELLSPDSFMDASTPGAFFLPVCINDRFHQATTLDSKIWDDLNQSSDKKTLPCSCGNFWGDETEAVWRDTGLGLAKHQEKYRTWFCSTQLDKKLEGSGNSLERYVADCRIKISRQGFFNMYQDGPHAFCDVVIHILTAHGRNPDEVDPYLRLALECKAGLHGQSKKGKKECEMYTKAGFDELVNKKHPRYASWFPNGAW